MQNDQQYCIQLRNPRRKSRRDRTPITHKIDVQLDIWRIFLLHHNYLHYIYITLTLFSILAELALHLLPLARPVLYPRYE